MPLGGLREASICPVQRKNGPAGILLPGRSMTQPARRPFGVRPLTVRALRAPPVVAVAEAVAEAAAEALLPAAAEAVAAAEAEAPSHPAAGQSLSWPCGGGLLVL